MVGWRLMRDALILVGAVLGLAALAILGNWWENR